MGSVDIGGRALWVTMALALASCTSGDDITAASADPAARPDATASQSIASNAVPLAQDDERGAGALGFDANWSLDGAFLPDFSYAGYGFGLGEIPDFADATVLNAADYGVIPDDGLDDSRALLEALAASGEVSGPVRLDLPAGRIRLSSILPINRSDFVLRGAGSGEGGTEIYIPRPLSYIDTGGRFDEISEYLSRFDKVQREKDQNVEWPFSPYSWSGGFLWVGPDGWRAAPYLEEKDPVDRVLAEASNGERGGFNLSVDTTDALTVGDDIELVWYSRDGEDGGIIDELYGDTDLKVGSHHWSFPERGLVRQKSVIAALGNGSVTLADPLLHNITTAAPASLVDWAPLTDVGIEDLSIVFPKGESFGHHLEQGFNGIYMTGTRDGWIRDIRIVDADTGVLSYSSANLTIDNVTTEGDRVAHYSVHAGNVHNVLVSDLEVRNPVRHSLSVNTQSTKTVYQRAQIFRDAVLDQHAGSNHQNLFDQTIVHIDVAAPGEGEVAAYPIWDGSGAGYWQPGHGRYNTTYNLEVRVRSGLARGDTLRLNGLAEGPDARLIGLHGNRALDVAYQPEPLARLVGETPKPASLYAAQLAARREARQ